MTWVMAGLLGVAVVETLALVHLLRRLKAIDDLEARVSRFAAAMTLLTDTTEAGLSTVAGAL